MPIAGHKAAKQLEQRSRYARKIAEKYPSATELLEFYAEIAEFQLRLFQQNCNSVTSAAGSLRGAIDVEKVHSYLPDLLSTLERIGTPALQESAQLLRSETGTVTLKTFRDYVLGIEGDG